MPLLNRESPTPYYQQVYEQIAQGIDEGYYSVGEKLPSIRECARELGVSNTTVELAYQRLTEEGYVEARRGSGYAVCEAPVKPEGSQTQYTPEYLQALDELKAMPSNDATHECETYAWDFSYDAADHAAFPFTSWARICRDIFFSPDAESACLYNDQQGLLELREQIVRFLVKDYGITAVADQILIMPTTRDLVSEIMTLFDPPTTCVAMEEPGYDEVASKLRRSGYDTKMINTYPTPSWEAIEEQLEGTRVLYLTPACQFPTNATMPMALRERFVEWAQRTGAYIFDDEYGWEFQMGANRAPSLRALDHAGRVIMLGTFSSSFTPAVCLSFAVLPPQLMIKWRRSKGNAHPRVPWQTQAAMAVFMEEGLWRAHQRKMRTLMTKKRKAIVAAIEEHLGDSVQLLSESSSSFVLAQATDGRTEDELIRSAAQAGVRVYPTRQYWSGSVPDDWHYVLIGYAGIPINDIEPGIRALAGAWNGTAS